MIKKKLLNRKNNYCLLLPLVFIFFGCSTSSKKSELLSIQQQRIMKLERQLKKKEQVIEKMKVERWVNKPIRRSEAVAFVKLKKLMKQKKWIEALKESSRLKKSYPKSMKLTSYRHKIFKRMGLKKQARTESLRLKKFRAQLIKKRNRKLNGSY